MQPENDISLRLKATVASSEDADKVLRALTNVVGNSNYEVRRYDNEVVVKSRDPASLRTLRDQLRDRGVRAVARRLCDRGRRGDKVELMLNRQAAFQGVVALCSSEVESALGPLYLTISSSRIDSVIQWLTDWSGKPTATSMPS